jgi:hypothetical protein
LLLAFLTTVLLFVFGDPCAHSFVHGWPCSHGHSRISETKLRIRNIDWAVSHYQMDHNPSPYTGFTCPTDNGELVRKKYLTGERTLSDSYGTPLLFSCPGSHDLQDREKPDIVSAGKDKIFGTADDINSWDL